LALGALALNAGVLSYAPTTISTATGAATSTTQQLLQNSATTKAVTTATAADIASKTAEETKAILNGDAGKSTRLFGSSAPVITAAPVAFQQKIISAPPSGGGGAAGAAGANGMANVQAVCGAENFDDVVKSTFGKVELNKNYVDAYGKTCNLSTKNLYIFTITSHNVVLQWNGGVQSDTPIYSWVQLGTQKTYLYTKPASYTIKSSGGKLSHSFAVSQISGFSKGYTTSKTPGCKAYVYPNIVAIPVGESGMLVASGSLVSRICTKPDTTYQLTNKVETYDSKKLWFK
jgi:hypothetical protein